MAKEIERKFLVRGTQWRGRADAARTIRQAYLALTRKMAIRVRITGSNQAFLTIKSASSGRSRSEFEYPIPVKDARALIKLRTGHLIEKRRYVVKHGRARWEVDAFKGRLAGLTIAEIELASEHATFRKPEWLGREITRDKRYYNADLATGSGRLPRRARSR